ncbi:hypothetical protein [Terrisporobacter glycolicus]|uniref:DUF7973 domain-containing protein n=1 Tax=Terrisporobacter glycolicus ATCC 14880 = DSM 1288 TaxID=1121315 RepID=A0ABZ2ERP7_9FIRM|nr:hypothetical protein [Terrisporobacter glycolicus]
MSFLSLIAAFGGGAFGAALGALPAFIMTGFVALAGTGIALAGGADVLVGNLAFGSFFGPHIAFAGGVAAAAYAGRKSTALRTGQLSNGETAILAGEDVFNGSDITFALNAKGDYSIIIVGGIFGVIGFLINHLYANIIGLQTDTVAMTVATSGILARLILGKSGLIGKYTGTNSRAFISKGNELVYNIALGLVVGVVVSYTGAVLIEGGVPMDSVKGSYPALCFGISAITLIFAQFGTGVPTTHHISLPAANAFVLSGNPIVGIIVAILCALLGDFFTKTFNSYVDSHIDPPACTIFVMTFIILAIFA